MPALVSQWMFNWGVKAEETIYSSGIPGLWSLSTANACINGSTETSRSIDWLPGDSASLQSDPVGEERSVKYPRASSCRTYSSETAP